MSIRTIALWVVLILLFLGFYQLFSHPSSSPAGEGTFAFLASSPLPFIGLFAAIFGGLMARQRKGVGIINEGLALAQRGRFTQALERVERSRRYLLTSPLVPMHAGTMQLALWRLDKADVLLKKAFKPSIQANLQMNLAPRLALVAALRDSGDEASRLLAQAARLGNGDAPEALVAQMVLACRAARWGEALELGARSELRYLGGATRALLDALRGWAREQLGQPRQVVDVLAVLGEASLDAVRSAWPELADFLERAQRA